MLRGLNALQLALGSVGAGLSGYQKAQAERLEEERRRRDEQRELDRIKREEDRIARQEAALLRQEQRGALREGFITADRLSSLTMPGATPLPSMQPTMRQKIGEQEFVYVPGVAQAEEHKKNVMTRSLARAEKGYDQQQDEKRLTRLIAEASDPKTGGRNSKAAARLAAASKGAYDALFPEPRGGGGGGLSALQAMKREDEMDEAEAWYNLGERDPQKRADIGATYRRLREAKPNATQRELLLMTYNAIKSREASDYREAQTGAADRRGQKPAGRAPSSAPPGAAAPPTATRTPSAAPPRDELDAAYDSYNRR